MSLIRRRNRYPEIPAESPSRRSPGLTRVQRASILPGLIVIVMALIIDGVEPNVMFATTALALIAFVGGMMVGR